MSNEKKHDGGEESGAEINVPAKTKSGSAAQAPERSVAQVPNDPLDRETAIAAVLEDRGLKLKTNSRAIAAFDRLIGNIIDWPSSWVEQHRDKSRSRTSLQGELTKMENDREIELARTLPIEGSVYDLRHRREQIEKDRNRLMITLAAIDDLKRAPEAEILDAKAATQIDSDWLSEFSELASRKSNEDIQTLWGKLLAGEIRSPGFCSLLTLQRLSAIDSADAAKIHNFLKYNIGNHQIWRDPSNSIFEISLGEALGMEDLGIVTSASGQIIQTYKLGAGDAINLFLVGDVLQIIFKKESEYTMPVYALSSFGQALCKLLHDEVTPDGYLSAIYNTIDRNVAQLYKAKIISRSPQDRYEVEEFSEV